MVGDGTMLHPHTLTHNSCGLFLSGAPWWICHVSVSPLTDNSRTNTVQIRVSFFFKLGQNGVRGGHVASTRG